MSNGPLDSSFLLLPSSLPMTHGFWKTGKRQKRREGATKQQAAFSSLLFVVPRLIGERPPTTGLGRDFPAAAPWSAGTTRGP